MSSRTVDFESTASADCAIRAGVERSLTDVSDRIRTPWPRRLLVLAGLVGLVAVLRDRTIAAHERANADHLGLERRS